MTATQSPPARAGTVELGLIAAPALAGDTVEELARDLRYQLRKSYPEVDWKLAPTRDGLVTPPVELTELVDAARDRLLEEGWDLVVCVTDLPLRLARRPLVTHSSPTHGVALVSLPALGVRRVSAKLLDSIVTAVGVLAGDAAESAAKDGDGARPGGVQRRLLELASEVEDPSAHGSVTFLARVVTGNVRLILGMIRANRPWRLVGHLSRALVGALAATSAALVVSDVWRLSTSLDPARLALLTLLSTGIAVVTLINAHELWERAQDRRAREQVALFNLVTLLTVTFGLLTLYAAVFLATLGAAALLIDSSLLEDAIGRQADAWDYVKLAWLASSLATVGGALGGVLESDATVREAAYAYRTED